MISMKGLSRLAAVLATTTAALGALATPSSAIEFDAMDVDLLDRSGQPERRAGSHPNLRVRFAVPSRDPSNPNALPIEQPHRFKLDLPPGLIGNPMAVDACPEADLKGANNGGNAFCRPTAQVGLAVITTDNPAVASRVPVYNVERPVGAPAQFAFTFLHVVVKITPSVRSGDFGLSIDSGEISQGISVKAVDVTMWGVPADPVNNAQRVPAGGVISCFGTFCTGGGATVSSAPKPFLSLPTSCGAEPASFVASLDGWETIGAPAVKTMTADSGDESFTFEGCSELPFAPAVDVGPSSQAADGPTGLEVDLRVPQTDNPNARAAGHVKDVTMVLPPGMSVSPSSAVGLGACSPAEIGLGTDVKPSCPPSSKLGTVSIETPLLAEPLTGDVILATPDQNPFSSLVALYIVAEGSGVRIKLPGKVDMHPVTGRLTARFSSNPQLPFSALKVRFDGGPNASLATPTTCGTHVTHTEVTSWSGKTVNLTSPMVVDQNCGPRGFAPGIQAGSVVPSAGRESPFSLTVTRPDGQQNVSRIDTVLPPGLLAWIGNIDLCGEAQASVGSCPAGSLVGSTQVLAGPGSAPLPVKGQLFMTGPYGGAPFGMSIVVPTAGQSGPFDLGNVVVRAKVHIDRTTAQVTVVSDPMPQLLRGIPLRLQRVNVTIDRPGYMFNPSGCGKAVVATAVHSINGATSRTHSPYGLLGCGDLKQDQKLKLAFTNKTQTRPGKHPGVRATVTSKGVGATNLEKVEVKLPLSVALDPDNARALCKPAQRVARNCPKESIIGRASAKSVLPNDLTGPVYFVEGTRVTKAGKTVPTLPKLWIPLSANGVTIDLDANSNVDKQQRLTTVFAALPDAPISSFSLRIDGGKHGILTIPPNKAGGTCNRDRTIDMRLTGQNGKRLTRSIKASVAGCKKSTKKKSSATKRTAAATARSAR